MHTDVIIVGQGISGTWLSYYLFKEGKSVVVIDKEKPDSPSRISAGVINPVTGRRHVTVWMADKALPFAWNAYTEIGDMLRLKTITQQNIIDFFPSPQMRQSFMERIEENALYLNGFTLQNHFYHLFNYDFGYGQIRPVYVVYLEKLLPAWRKELKEKNCLIEESFDVNQLVLANGKVSYKDLTADKIIFCDGTASTENPYFKNLPFAPNKGEMLILEIPELPPRKIYKRGMMLVPLAEPGLWWLGSSYEWEFNNTEPTKEFRQKAEILLKEWLKKPFKVVQHLSGIRPATLERRPFVGLHPQEPAIGILNGMGTKGCSLAPYFAKQLTNHLYKDEIITPEADVKRFSKILSR